ncbi:MAG: hypothetical protein JW763_05730, partial [candidate division Zixibacteria bacterium]|nr:hypothetical protein [candidate division Zixibacteria bacterium]
IIARVIYDKRWYVVRNTVSVLARIGNQRAAFQALAENRSQKAEVALKKYSRSFRKKICRMASQALVWRRGIMYGE